MAESLRFAIALRGEGGQTHFNSDVTIADEGRPQGAPLPIVFSRRYALRRAPTRGAPTNSLLSAFCPEKGVHKGCPRFSSFGLALKGHPQGVPLPIVFSRRFALRRAPTRGAPANCLLSAYCPGKGAHKGRPYQLSSLGVCRRAPTRGAPTDCLLSTLCPGKGAHKGCPYRLSSSTLCPGKGAHKGCPYRLSSLDIMPWEGRPQGVPPIVFFRVWPWEGHPQGVPLPIVFSRRLALGRAPTRGAPTDCLLAAFGPGKGAHKGCPYRLSSFGVMP